MGIDAFDFKNHQFPEEDRDKRRKEGSTEHSEIN